MVTDAGRTGVTMHFLRSIALAVTAAFVVQTVLVLGIKALENGSVWWTLASFASSVVSAATGAIFAARSIRSTRAVAAFCGVFVPLMAWLLFLYSLMLVGWVYDDFV